MPKGLFHIDRRRSDTDALRHSLSDAKLARQRLLKYAHVKSTDSDHQDLNNVVTTKNIINNEKQDENTNSTASISRTTSNDHSSTVDTGVKTNAKIIQPTGSEKS